jgi:hypothetical protein
MAYMLLCVLPKEIVEIIYHFNNSEYAFIYFTKFTVKKNGKINSVLYPLVHDLNELYQKHMKIENIYNYLTSMLVCNSRYSRPREELQPLLHDISKHLMFCYNIWYVEDSLKKENTKKKHLIDTIKLWFNCTEDSLKKDNTKKKNLIDAIKLWFKLCQKYNLYLLLCFIKDDKIYKGIFNTNKMGKLETFSHFLISPIVLLNKFNNKEFINKDTENLLYNEKYNEKYNKYQIGIFHQINIYGYFGK